MRTWGKVIEKDTKNSAKSAGIQNFTGLLQSKGIEWRQRKRSDVGHLFIRQYGVVLDSMPAHAVSVHRRRTRLLAWAKQAKSSWIKRKALAVENRTLKLFWIYVKPHPFIRNGYLRARPKLRPMLLKNVKRGINIS